MKIVDSYILNQFKGDRTLWVVSIILMLFSLLLVYSATGSLAYKNMGGNTEAYLLRHFSYLVIALLAMFVCHKVDYIYFSKISRYALLLSVPLLIIAWQFGSTYNDASRWLTIPIIDRTFQPSDLAKLAIITNLASMLSKRQLSITEFKKAIRTPMIWCGIVCGLIGLTDWSSAALLFVICWMLLFISRVPIKYLGLMVVIGITAGIFAYTFGQRGATVSSRLKTYLSNTETSYQEEQSHMAVASGGITGKGIGKSTQKNFLPHPYSDFIFAIIVEEYGFLGALLIIILYLILLYRGMLITMQSKRTFGSLLAAGLIFSIVAQGFINMAVVVGILPITGLPLPLVSMGGTSLFFTGIALGIVLSVSRTDNFLEEALNKKMQWKNTPRTAKEFAYDGATV